MTEEILFTVTRDKLETGLRGFPVGYCTTSTVDPYKGLFYAGIPIAKLATSWRAEEVIYLLMFGREGSLQEVERFFADLNSRASLRQETVVAIEGLPRAGHPMQLFAAALLILGMTEKSGDYKEDCYRLIAKVPHLVAVVINHHAGWGKTPLPQPECGYVENFARMIQPPGANVVQLTRALTLFTIVHYDHGGGNLSTFIGKAVASGLEDIFGSVASAMCALAGPRHGRANQDCLESLKEFMTQLGEGATIEQMESAIRDQLTHKKVIFGFGHAVLRVEDPRARVIYDYLEKNFPTHPLVKISILLRRAGSKVLAENSKISDPHPNIDAISGALLAVSGFDYPHYFTVLFGLARIVGIARQIVYERVEARGGKGTPIVRPKYLYKGPKIMV